MCDVMRPPSACVKETGTIKGRGVFSSRSYPIGEVVELCPVVILPIAIERLPTEIDLLLFDWASLANVPGTQALALGFGSLYNDANPANMKYEADASLPALRFVAARNIAPDEELTINYSAMDGGAVSADNNWFERKGIARYSEAHSRSATATDDDSRCKINLAGTSPTVSAVDRNYPTGQPICDDT
jgi:hypothetical protein